MVASWPTRMGKGGGSADLPSRGRAPMLVEGWRGRFAPCQPPLKPKVVRARPELCHCCYL